MKKRFLLLGGIALLALTSCDSKDTKEIQKNIEGKSNEEIIQMVADANTDANVEEELKSGAKLTGNVLFKGNLDPENMLGVGGELSLSADVTAIYNSDGSQTTASANVSVKDSDSKESTAKVEATIESLNSEDDVYSYSKISSKVNGTESNQTSKIKTKKTTNDESSSDEILKNLDIDIDNVDVNELKDFFKDCEVSVDNGLLLFTKTVTSDTQMPEGVSVEGLSGSVIVGFDKDYQLRKLECSLSATKLSASENETVLFSVSNLNISFKVNLEAGSFTFKSLEDKGSYIYSIGSLF